jgi:Holliday junction resolvasome RuvABC endonuclease subunit
MKRVLGFDVSSTTIGYGVLEIDDDNKINFVLCNYIKPNKNGTIIERIVETRNMVQSIIDQVKPDFIAIEDIIQFMQGHSTAKTIIMLTTFNRMIGLTAHDYLHESPALFSVMTIRHGLKLGKAFPKKEEIPELVAKHLNISFPYLSTKSKTTKKGKKIESKIKVESYDMADGVAVALYYAFVLTGRAKPKGKKP